MFYWRKGHQRMWNQNAALHRVIRYLRAITLLCTSIKNKLKFAIRITLASTSTVIKVAK